MITLGIDRLIASAQLRKQLKGHRIALLGHPASVTSNGQHSLDVLMALGELTITAAFGPQHGMRGDKQDNMIESPDERDPRHGIPVYSLYGTVRYPTPQMLDSFDILLVDLQDIGTRIYTYVTTLAYLIDACARAGKALWILDRPNPAGRPLEGSLLQPGWESFVGAAPMLMRHGLTLGELACWLARQTGASGELNVVRMHGYQPDTAPGCGWPLGELAWISPSPNASSLNMARCFPGTVLLEGTTLSEGRGTATPLELFGAPDIDGERLLAAMRALAPQWLEGVLIRPVWFEPTFHKHVGQRCGGLQLHTDCASYDHWRFRPYRLVALALKALRELAPEYPLWRAFHYEYERERLAIDLLSGGTRLREWVDDPNAGTEDLERYLASDEAAWKQQIDGLTLYD